MRGEWQPLEARILAAVSVYADAVLDGHRNPALSPHDARLSMSDEAGRTLDENVVRTFLRVLDEEDANYATAADDRFASPRRLRGTFLLNPQAAPGTQKRVTVPFREFCTLRKWQAVAKRHKRGLLQQRRISPAFRPAAPSGDSHRNTLSVKSFC